MSHPVVLDIETQYTFQEVGNDCKKLKISVVGTYDYGKDKYKVYRENELNELFSLLEHASVLIGFNIRKFDMPVLAPYYIGDISQFPLLDIMEEAEKALGFRPSLDDLSKASLGVAKTGHGFLAIDYFRNGEWEKLEKYCLHDVEMTKNLFDLGKTSGKLFFPTPLRKKEITVSFDLEKNKNTPVSLSLPF